MLLTGCWNRRELNELAVVLAVGIDSAYGQYAVSVQVSEPLQMSRNRGSDRSLVKMYVAHIRCGSGDRIVLSWSKQASLVGFLFYQFQYSL